MFRAEGVTKLLTAQLELRDRQSGFTEVPVSRSQRVADRRLHGGLVDKGPVDLGCGRVQCVANRRLDAEAALLVPGTRGCQDLVLEEIQDRSGLGLGLLRFLLLLSHLQQAFLGRGFGIDGSIAFLARGGLRGTGVALSEVGPNRQVGADRGGQ